MCWSETDEQIMVKKPANPLSKRNSIYGGDKTMIVLFAVEILLKLNHPQVPLSFGVYPLAWRQCSFSLGCFSMFLRENQ